MSGSRKLEKKRRKHLLTALRAWHKSGRDMKKIPTLRKALALGTAEQIYRDFGLRPGIDVYVPESSMIDPTERRRFKYRKYEKPASKVKIKLRLNT